jgi:hypothetical protein
MGAGHGRVVVNDRMQKNYVYFLTEPVGRNFHPGFAPELSPPELLRLGVFGGKYMTDCARGWLQWYCRYYMGRRSADNERQIRRWRAIGRHIAQRKKHCRRGDLGCRPKQKQALLHWAYDSRNL